MNTNLNKRSGYVFKPLSSIGSFLMISKTGRNNLKNEKRIVEQKRKKIQVKKLDLGSENLKDLTGSYIEKYYSLKKNVAYKKRIFEITDIMLTKIPMLHCGESLD
ncbi:hypothetical protein BH10BAC5_BH10BAC5_17650 [soil metagenome]